MVPSTPRRRDPLDCYSSTTRPGAPSHRNSGRRSASDSHVPFELDLGERRVINPGSIGQPRDGDPRASYAVIEDGRVSLRRTPYDIDAVLRQMQTSGVQPWVVELTESVLRTGGRISREDMDRIV